MLWIKWVAEAQEGKKLNVYKISEAIPKTLAKLRACIIMIIEINSEITGGKII